MGDTDGLIRTMTTEGVSPSDENSTPLLTFSALNAAWWKWVDENCPSKSSRARGQWMHSHDFTHDGTIWTRVRQTMKSNSGKTTWTTAEHFVGADGRVIGWADKLEPNRRNDPKRNWGLPE